VFLVDRNERRRRLLEAALELEGLEDDTEPADARPDAENNHIEQVIMMSPKAARRFGIRPVD